MDNPKRPLFISLAGFTYSRGGVYLNSNNRICIEKDRYFEIPNGFWRILFRLISKIRLLASEASNIVVLSPSHLLVPLIKITTGKQIILDAGWSLTEAEITRWRGIKNFPRILKCVAIDFMAFQIASKILVESNHQKTYIASKFFVRNRKIFVLFTGINEANFGVQSQKPFEILGPMEDKKVPIVLFRGSYTKEAGIELLAAVSKRMETNDIQFVVSCRNIPKEIIFAKNTVLISRKISNNEMKYLYENATVCIGQISDRPRLKNTIPHKAFEAAFFRKPYLSADASGIRELLPSNNQCFYLSDISIVGLEKAIIEITENVTLQKNLTSNISKRYEAVATQEILSERFFTLISD